MKKKKLVPDAITFDVFGTIINSPASWYSWFTSFFVKRGITDLDPKKVGARCGQIQFGYLGLDGGEFLDHYELKKTAFRDLAKEMDWSINDDDLEDFSHLLDHCKAFPDSADAIAELRKYTKVYALTNSTTPIVTSTFEREGIEVDGIMTSDDIRAYKPNHKVFRYSQEVLGLNQDHILHCAQGFLYDIVPASSLGYDTVWVNRNAIQRPADAKETYMVGDLKTLAILMEGFAATDEKNGFR